MDITIKYSKEKVLVSITNEDDANKELTSLDFNTGYAEYFKKYDFNMEYDKVLGLNKLHMKVYPVADE